MGCITSRTVPRRFLIWLFPGRRPGRTAPLQLATFRRIAGFADWLQVRAETAAMELEDIVSLAESRGREAGRHHSVSQQRATGRAGRQGATLRVFARALTTLAR